MTTGGAGEISRIVDRILAVQGPFTPDSVSEACSVTLFEVPCTNPHMREFEAHPETGPLSTITFRGSRTLSGPPKGLVIMDVSAGCQITQAELTTRFHLSSEHVSANPRIPPEGVISFQERRGLRTLYLQFIAGARTLHAISVHEMP